MKLERETNNNNEKLGKWGNLGRLLFSCFLAVSEAFHPCFEVRINSCFHGFIHVSAQQPLLMQVPGHVLHPGSQGKCRARV